MSEINGSPKAIISRNDGVGIYTESENPKLITNFNIEILAKIDSYSSPKAKPKSLVKLRLYFEDGQQSDEFTVHLTELGKIKWLEKDDRCILNPEIAPTKAQRCIENKIREDLLNVQSEKQYLLNQLGMHIIDGEAVFCIGNEVIRPIEKTNLSIVPETIQYTLDFDPNLDEEEAVAEMLDLISLFPDVGRLLLAYNLLYFMRALYEVVWNAPRFCLFIYGQTGSLKTTLSSFLSQVYNRGSGIANPPRLNSTPAAAIEILYEMSDCVTILDDLFPTDIGNIKRSQEQTLYEIIRVVGDCVKPGRMNGKKISKAPPTAGVVFTAEYLIADGSSAARLLSIEVNPPAHETSKQFKYFQDKPLIVSTFYRNFIRWIISNYGDVRETLKEWREFYNQDNFTVYGHEVHNRLMETHFYMNTAYIVFLDYCLDKEFITHEEAQSLQQSFLKLLTNLVFEQQERVLQCSLNRPTAKVDYLAFIKKLYLAGRFKLAVSPKDFDLNIHDSIIHLECLNIYGDKFREIISIESFNVDSVLDDLESQGALKTGKDGRTIQIYISQKKKLRFYAIKMTHLK